MKIYLTNQSVNFHHHLNLLKAIPVMQYEKGRLAHKVSTVSLMIDKPLAEVNLSFLFDYEIFPANIMTHFGEWQAEGRLMGIGDTIVQQVFIPPFGFFSQKIVFGVRINNIINEPKRKGFSYETLAGHAEKGLSIFTVEESGGDLLFKIETFSSPGNVLSRLLGSIFTRPYQSFCTWKALDNVRNQIDGLS